MRGQILTEHHLKYFEYLVSSRSAKWLALRGQLSCPIIHVQGPALRSHVTAQCHYLVIMAERAMQSDVWYLHWDVLSVNCQHAFQKMFAKTFEQLHKKLGAWTREISCTEMLSHGVLIWYPTWSKCRPHHGNQVVVMSHTQLPEVLLTAFDLTFCTEWLLLHHETLGGYNTEAVPSWNPSEVRDGRYWEFQWQLLPTQITSQLLLRKLFKDGNSKYPY